MPRIRKSTGLRQSIAQGSSPGRTVVENITTPLSITLPLLHPRQAQVRDDDTRFRVLACGRRWGKTRLAVALALEKAITKRGLVWWIAPSYKQTLPGWRLIVALCRQIPGAVIRQSDRMVILPGGGEIWAKSADDPDSLRGEGLVMAVLDECAYMAERVWTGSIRPALADKKGSAVFISTPSGRNWFYRLYLKGSSSVLGKSGVNSTWASYRFPTSTNPYIDPQEIAAAEGDMPELLFQQEFLAEFLHDAGTVFRNVGACVVGSDPEIEGRSHTYPRTGFSTVLGGDWGQKADFTVLYVGEAETRTIFASDRFQQVSWSLQRQRLIALVERYNVGYALMEENSIGAPNIEALQEENVPVVGWWATNQSKDEIIRKLVLAFEKETITVILPEDERTGLINELESYEMNRTPTGKWRFSAPEGLHDDRVIALALVNQAFDEGVFLAEFV